MPADLDDSVRRLCDAEAIRNLIASYGVLADRGDAAAVAALWTEGGEYDVGGFDVARGRRAIAALIDGDTHRSLVDAGCAHVLSPHRIEIDGDRAIAEGYSTVYRKEGQGIEPWRVSRNTWHLLRAVGDRWLVERRVNRPI